MQLQFDNLAITSFYLWLDNRILNKGTAYSNYSSKIYPMQDAFNGLFSYSLPFKQIVSDSSVSGASIMTGVYLNGELIPTGVSGFFDVNYAEGQVYFTQNVDNHQLSGDYAVKDFNIYLTSEPDYKILFETQYKIRQKTSVAPAALGANELTIPALFIRPSNSEDKPFAFGGQEKTEITLRVVILADSQFLLDAVSSILRDSKNQVIPILSEPTLPFNNYGGFKNSGYNYNNIKESHGSNPNVLYVDSVTVSRFNSQSVILTELKNINPSIYVGLADFELCAYRTLT